jgi:predicted nicotinamide N-methyase
MGSRSQCTRATSPERIAAGIVLAGDVSYERDMAERVTGWLAALASRGASVLIGDPGRTYLARDQLQPIAEYCIPVTRALEDVEIKRTQVWAFRETAQ